MSKNTLSFTVLLLLATISGGCANTSYFEPTPLADSANAMVYVYRPGGSNPGKKPLVTSFPEILVDGDSVGMLKNKKYLAVELAPGTREFVATGLTREARWEPKDRMYALELEAGESYFLRLGVEFNTRAMTIGSFTGQYIINLHHIDESDAIYEIRELSKAP
ncbi:DUF2846 domain-containing protein [Congregibacter sp.]|uniref:DUF2846 domain-containing protein n=1 Tax=Congregibacter sp. TaxID=2744308 RepID=UPI003F6B301A